VVDVPTNPHITCHSLQSMKLLINSKTFCISMASANK
jgi:hypothetical protein